MKMRGSSFGTSSETFSGTSTMNNIPESALKELKEYYGFDKPVILRYFIWLKGMFSGDFGKSTYYSEPVIKVILERVPVSVYFGLTGFILIYAVCVPLGVLKAVKHGSKFDLITSIMVFIGYSLPGWAFGSLLLVLFGGGSFLGIFPLGGFTSANFSELNFIEKVIDVIHHTILPVISYLISGFAALTVLTKNSVMENIENDYVKFARSKGIGSKRVLFKHVLGNSMIPITTGLGHFLSIIVTGSILIEKVFNINGMGLLAFNSVLNRDYPVTMGILVISSFLMILGNVISDLIYVFVDPRIRFK